MQNMFKYAIKQVLISLLIISVFASQWSTAHIHLPQDHNHHDLSISTNIHEDAFNEPEHSHSHQLEHHNHNPADHLFDLDGSHSSDHVVLLDSECALSHGKLFKPLAILPTECEIHVRGQTTASYIISYHIHDAAYESPSNLQPPSRAPPA